MVHSTSLDFADSYTLKACNGEFLLTVTHFDIANKVCSKETDPCSKKTASVVKGLTL